MIGDWKGRTVLSRDGATKGIATGATHPCRMEGCRGHRITVKWPDGKHTHPCSKGLSYVDLNTFRID